MKFSASIVIATALLVPQSDAAQSFYVDVTNAVANPQTNLPTGFAHHPSYDYAGAGFSAGSGPFSPAGQGTYYTADGFLTGFTANGLWQSSWLDALHPDTDAPPHGGLGTVDILTSGGISGALGLDPAIYGRNMPAPPPTAGDTNNQYLGIGGDVGASEYAVWSTTLDVTAVTTFQYDYSWIAAGATAGDGSELLPLGAVNMGAIFFLDNDTDYSNGILYSASSALDTYDGAGNQVWRTESGTVTLNPGSYYWGFRATSDGPSYIGVEGISIVPIPEPSGALLAIGSIAALGLRRRRTA